jgi:DNA (cytosine-5)-methyltransferase 1
MQNYQSIMGNKLKLVSLFSGCGGLDLGFEKAGYEIVWANEYDKDIWETYRYNHKSTFLDTRSITDIDECEIPECDGIIGGPPCQSWSEGGAKRGINDKRGQLFYDYIRVLKAKHPLFFLAENVSGMLLERHSDALNEIKELFKEAGYTLSFQMLNACDYNVPQDRKRVFFVGIRNDLGLEFQFPEPSDKHFNLRDAIGDLPSNPTPVSNGVKVDKEKPQILNHEYMTGGFSSIYMSRNRVRSWNEPSFTIQAQARQAPIHPQAPKMTFISDNLREFQQGKEHLYRRLSVRECARIQTFPDDFLFVYKNIAAGYKMIGNAVPVNLAYAMAESIRKQLSSNVK